MVSDAESLLSDGWTRLDDGTFPASIGRVFVRSANGDGKGIGNTDVEIGLLCEQRQGNLSGIVHGGAIMTLLDRTMGVNCRAAVDWPMLTATMSVNFVRPAQIGDFLRFRCKVLKVARNAVFAEARGEVEGKEIAMATGTFVRRDWAAPNDSVQRD